MKDVSTLYLRSQHSHQRSLSLEGELIAERRSAHDRTLVIIRQLQLDPQLLQLLPLLLLGLQLGLGVVQTDVEPGKGVDGVLVGPGDFDVGLGRGGGVELRWEVSVVSCGKADEAYHAHLVGVLEAFVSVVSL